MMGRWECDRYDGQERDDDDEDERVGWGGCTASKGRGVMLESRYGPDRVSFGVTSHGPILSAVGEGKRGRREKQSRHPGRGERCHVRGGPLTTS
jgi:hypothetical protein